MIPLNDKEEIVAIMVNKWLIKNLVDFRKILDAWKHHKIEITYLQYVTKKCGKEMARLDLGHDDLSNAAVLFLIDSQGNLYNPVSGKDLTEDPIKVIINE